VRIERPAARAHRLRLAAGFSKLRIVLTAAEDGVGFGDSELHAAAGCAGADQHRVGLAERLRIRLAVVHLEVLALEVDEGSLHRRLMTCTHSLARS